MCNDVTLLLSLNFETESETENFYSNETKNFDSNLTVNFRTILPVVVSDYRLKEESPTKNFRESEYIDIGEKSDADTYRDVIFLN